MIELKNVTKIFDAGRESIEAVKNVNLTIEQGEIFGIIGFSGAGKSTLVRCINLLERPSSGEVIFEGTDLTKLPEKQLRLTRKKMGMIFQQFNLLGSRTVFHNIAYPLKYSGLKKDEIEKKVKDLLELVDLSDKISAYPSQLSGGQKQRVAIARALASDPKILLCDEATSALDPQTTGSILALLKQLNRQLGLTIVVITHEMQVVKQVCDRVAVMDRGEVVECGDVFGIFAAPKEAITRDFISTTSNLSKIDDMLAQDSPITKLGEGDIILKFKYLEKSVSEALVSIISRRYHLDVNIIFGDIEIIGEAPLGGLVTIVSGKAGDIDEAIEFLKSKNVGVEVLADARVSK